MKDAQADEQANDIVCVGGDHHNGLGLARSFGRCGYKPYGIIITSGKSSFIAKSKYWQKTWLLSSEEYLPEFLLSHFEKGAVVIPYSDRAAQMIDEHLSTLRGKFFVPSIREEEGQISRLMDKFEQIRFAGKYAIPMAKSCIVSLPSALDFQPDIPFPCILKPVTSAEGDKRDIVKCEHADAFEQAVRVLTEKGYSRILAQEFIDYDYEFLFCGSCGNQPAYLIRKNLRSWPQTGGTASYGQCMAESENCKDTCLDILKALQAEGFNGLFDIELFRQGDRILLNEINWRNTGASFFCKGTGVEYAVIWYLEMIGKQNQADSMKHFCADSNQFQMNEATDLRHVVYGNLKLRDWLKDLRQCQSFALWYPDDMCPVFYRYCHLIFEMIKRFFCK